SSGDACASEVEVEVEGGALIGVGIAELGARPTLGGAVNNWWAPAPSFRVGLQIGLEMTVLPYGCDGGCAGVSERFTELPRLSFGARLLVPPSIAIGASAGPTFIVVGPSFEVALPLPTAGVTFETKLGAASRLELRAGVNYIHVPYGQESQ